MPGKVKNVVANKRIVIARRSPSVIHALLCALLLVTAAQPSEARLSGRARSLANLVSRPFTTSVRGSEPLLTRGLLPAKSEGESRFTSLDQTRIHYVSYGQGREALVLIHGWTCNLEYWRDQIPDFTKRSRVIAIDLPGHGQSDKPEIAYSMDLFARAVDAVLRDAGVERAVLVGHSMGTPVARQFYRKYPQKTLAIVVVDGALRPFGDKKMMEGFIATFRGPNYKEAGAGMFKQMAGPNLSAEAQEQIKASFLKTPQHVIVSAMEGMADDSIWGDDKINVPVLAILAKSPFYPADTEQFYKGVAPKIDFQMWEGVGHFLMMEKPRQFNDTVLAFLDKNALLKK